MTLAEHTALVVGLDGTSAGDAALRWGADEAARSGLPLLLLCGQHIAGERAEGRARHSIDAALATLETTHPAVQAGGRVVRGKLGDAMPVMSGRADTVILGTGIDHALSAGLLAPAVPKQSPAPVVITPDYTGPAADGEVVVAINLGGGTHRILAYAFEHARRHAAPVRIICRWPPKRTPSTPATVTYRDTEERLFDILSVWQNIYPEVKITASVIAAQATAQMILAAEHARLVVIGAAARRGPEWALRRRAHRLIRWTRRPVAIVPGGPIA